jgi:hypothetical protein
MALDLSALTNPYGQELAGIERNRALATALLSSGSQQPKGEMISGRYVAPSFAQQINPLLQTGVGLYAQNQADKKQLELANTAQAKQAQLLRAYGEAATPQEKFAIGTNQYAPAALQAATWDRLKTQKIGEGETLYEGGINGYTPSAVGGIKVDTEMRRAMQQLGLNKPLDQITPQELKAVNSQIEFNNRSKANVNNIQVHTGNALGAEFGKTIGEEDAALRKAAKNAQMSVDQADQALKNLPKAITGQNADVRLAAAKVFNVLGANNQDTIRASEQAFAQRSQALLGRVKSSGLAGSQGLTEGERKFLTNAYGGNLNLDESSLRSMLMLEKRLAQRDAQLWNQRIKEMPQEVVKGTGVSPVVVPNLGDIDANNPLLKPKE